MLELLSPRNKEIYPSALSTLWDINCLFVSAFRPASFDPSRLQYNSDHSELIIHSVNKADYGEYICTATNKISEDSATIMLDVFGWFSSVQWLLQTCFWTFLWILLRWLPPIYLTCFISEVPEVFVSAERLSVSVGERVSVSCNVSGHPQPELYWLNKHSGHTMVRVFVWMCTDRNSSTHHHLQAPRLKM